ncbi:hypothetical protein JW766_03680 [Candidatus Dojkabacteria bacterium]|nr:hypothetical protein [Candidatus Dojkabacteria bacterium]
MIEQKEEMVAIRKGVFAGSEMVFDSDNTDLAFWVNDDMEFIVLDIMTHSVLMDFGFGEFSNLKNILMSLDIPDPESMEEDEEILYDEGLYTIIVCRTNGEIITKWQIKDRHRCMLTFKDGEWYELIRAMKAINVPNEGKE